MELSSEDWQAINRCVVRLYRELDEQRHPRLLLELINGLVPLNSAAVSLLKPPDDLVGIGFPDDFVTPELTAQVARYVHQSPYAAYYLATRDASWKRTRDFMPVEDFHKLDIYRHALKGAAVNYQLGGFLFTMDDTAHIITLHRTHRGFTERERDIVNTLHPHLVTSYINAIVCSRAENSVSKIKAVMETAPGAYGYFDRQGKVEWLQEKAKEWLREFFVGEAFGSGNVPASVQQLVLESREQGAAPKQLEQVKGDEILVICIGSSPVGGWIMRLERKPKKPLPHFRPLPQLSKRQNEVLQWMVEGKRNTEIGRILCISPRTVEKHVSEILTTLKVENRATAILAAMESCAKLNAG